jgi:hypothetical protein
MTIDFETFRLTSATGDLNAFSMSDFGVNPDGDEVSMFSLSTAEMCDVVPRQPKNAFKGTYDYDESGFPEMRRSREVNEDEASLFTLNTTMEFNVSCEPKNEVDDQGDIFANKVSESTEIPLVKKGKKVLEMRVQNNREKSRSKYKCGKCGEEKKHHICAVDQVRASWRRNMLGIN